MSGRDFEMATDEQGSDAVVHLKGEVDMDTSPLVRGELTRLRQAGVTRVVVDLAGVRFFDSTAIGAVVTAFKRFRAEGADLVLRSPSRGVAKVLATTGLDEVLTVER